MNTESIYQFLENRSLISEETVITLDTLLEKNPWFGGGQLLSALIKKQSGSPDADLQMAKAQLFLSNPLWANWQTLQSDEQAFKEPEFISTPAFEKPEQIIQISSVAGLTEKQENETETDTNLSFEPLHTIDYFASQGIRLKQEQLGNDSLSKQVKTFTQWLQSMKKIYHSEQGSGTKAEDKKITLMADASNESGEIITETMADVLLQQGKTLQAIALFEKLSLLHPEKSGYFATRISELKN